MKDKQVISISYDQEADVMYLSYEDVEAEAEEIGEGIFARYKPQDERLVGFTIINFSKKFDQETKNLEIPMQISA